MQAPMTWLGPTTTKLSRSPVQYSLSGRSIDSSERFVYYMYTKKLTHEQLLVNLPAVSALQRAHTVDAYSNGQFMRQRNNSKQSQSNYHTTPCSTDECPRYADICLWNAETCTCCQGLKCHRTRKGKSFQFMVYIIPHIQNFLVFDNSVRLYRLWATTPTDLPSTPVTYSGRGWWELKPPPWPDQQKPFSPCNLAYSMYHEINRSVTKVN